MIWASDKEKANHKYNVGILKKKNNLIWKIKEIKSPKSFIEEFQNLNRI